MIQLDIRKNKIINEFLKNYDDSKWNKLIPSLLEISVLNLYISFEKYIFSEKEIDSLIIQLKEQKSSKFKENPKITKIQKKPQLNNNEFNLSKNYFEHIRNKNFKFRKTRDTSSKNYSKSKNINEMDVSDSNMSSLSKIQINNFNCSYNKRISKLSKNRINTINFMTSNNSREKSKKTFIEINVPLEKDYYRNNSNEKDNRYLYDEKKLIKRDIINEISTKNNSLNKRFQYNERKESKDNTYLNNIFSNRKNPKKIIDQNFRNINNQYYTINYNTINKTNSKISENIPNYNEKTSKYLSSKIKKIETKTYEKENENLGKFIPIKIKGKGNLSFSFNNINSSKIKETDQKTIKNNNDNDIKITKIDDNVNENIQIQMDQKVNDLFSQKIKNIKRKYILDNNNCSPYKNNSTYKLIDAIKSNKKKNKIFLFDDINNKNENKHYLSLNNSIKNLNKTSRKNKLVEKNSKIINYNKENRNSKINQNLTESKIEYKFGIKSYIK